MQRMVSLKRLFAVLVLLGAGVAASAQTSDFKIGNRILPDLGGKLELSIGWGDQMYESVVWHKQPQVYGLLSESDVVNSNEYYKYSQHWFLEARYNFNSWLSVGGMLDVSGVSWKNVAYNGKGVFLRVNSNENFTNISLMPTVRFTYMHSKYVKLHSGLGAGLNVNFGTETDYRGRKTALAPAAYLNFVGVTGCYDRFFATLDLGALLSLNGGHEVYLVGSRLISVSVGIKL